MPKIGAKHKQMTSKRLLLAKTPTYFNEHFKPTRLAASRPQANHK